MDKIVTVSPQQISELEKKLIGIGPIKKGGISNYYEKGYVMIYEGLYYKCTNNGEYIFPDTANFKKINLRGK